MSDNLKTSITQRWRRRMAGLGGGPAYRCDQFFGKFEDYFDAALRAMALTQDEVENATDADLDTNHPNWHQSNQIVNELQDRLQTMLRGDYDPGPRSRMPCTGQTLKPGSNNSPA